MNEGSNFFPRRVPAIETNTAYKCENKFLYCSFQKYLEILLKGI